MLVLALVSACTASSIPTKQPLSITDIEPILIVPEDIPSGMSPGPVADIQISAQVFGEAQGKVQEVKTINGEPIGEVRIYLFRFYNDRDKVFQLLSLAESQEGIESIQVPKIGEGISARKSGPTRISLVFIRCAAVVMMSFDVGQSNFGVNHVVRYAQRLDKRLDSLLCP
jgi:hypothetical protein